MCKIQSLIVFFSDSGAFAERFISVGHFGNKNINGVRSSVWPMYTQHNKRRGMKGLFGRIFDIE